MVCGILTIMLSNSRRRKKKGRLTLTGLRQGFPALNNGHPAGWLVEAVGQEAADAATLFDAEMVELVDEGVVVRLGGERRAA